MSKLGKAVSAKRTPTRPPTKPSLVPMGYRTSEFVRHRSKRSYETIHRWDCPHVRRMKEPVPWNWAEGRDPREWLALGWFRPCSECCSDLIPIREELFGGSGWGSDVGLL